MPDKDLSPLALALGRVVTGLYIVSTRLDGEAIGFVGSFLVQTGFEPPTLCVAIGKGRQHLEAVRSHGSFAVSILDADSQGSMGAFFKKPAEGKSAFDGIEHSTTPSGCAVLSGALAWLDCKLAGEHATGDHVVVFGQVTDGRLLREGDPSVHLRRDGLGY